MSTTFDFSKLKVEFGGKNVPKDEKLLELLKQAYDGELSARVALIKEEGIRPFSNFKPNISEEFRRKFEDKEKQEKPPPLYVYPFANIFIMSDDYFAYYMYKEKHYSIIMCIVLGDSDSEYIVEKSKPFFLPPQEIKVISKK